MDERIHNKNNKPITLQMQRDLLDMLNSNIYVALVMTIITFSGLVFGFANEKQPVKVALWSVLCVVVVLRLIDTIYWNTRLKGTDYSPAPVQARFALGICATGVIWATYAVLLFDSMSLIEAASTMVIFATMASGAASMLAPNRWLVYAYCTLLLVPISIVAIVSAGDNFMILGILGLMFWVGIFATSSRYHQFFLNTVTIRAQNNTLVEQMRNERQETAKINTILRKTNAQLDDANANLEQQIEQRTADIFRISNRDPLTNLLNRNGFLKHLHNLLDTTKALNNNLALLFIDLDGFKQVNDSLGHKIGDIVLAEIAHRLSQYSEKDQLARWGGDEFVAVIPYATEHTAIAVAHAMRSGVTIPIVALDNQITLDATIGIAIYPNHGSDAMELIQHADLTMYEQKRKQRGTIGVFSESLHDKIKTEQHLCEKLRHAIENGEFSVYYQPIMNSDNQKISSVEALLRWNCDGKNIPPTRFIPLAERTGLMPQIGTWVLNRACIDASQWSFSQPISLSVNVSISQLLDDNFVKALDNVLNTSAIPPASLSLEITESVFANNEEMVVSQIKAIKERGVKISIDDFGTGFSSLSRLQSMPCDFIKIDRSFVQNTSEGNDTIIRATLLIAREFGCKTIAEGIETLEQMHHIKSLGVDYFQGFYYSKPMPTSDFIIWYNKNN